jgi:hypothetical protein
MTNKTVLIGATVFIVIIIMYNYLLVSKKCNSQITYFNREFNIIPKIHTVSETQINDTKEGLNDKIFNIQNRKPKYAEIDVMIPRWMGGISSQSKYDNMGRSNYSFTCKQTKPTDFNPIIKNHTKNKKYISHNLNNSKMKRLSFN